MGKPKSVRKMIKTLSPLKKRKNPSSQERNKNLSQIVPSTPNKTPIKNTLLNYYEKSPSSIPQVNSANISSAKKRLNYNDDKESPTKKIKCEDSSVQVHEAAEILTSKVDKLTEVLLRSGRLEGEERSEFIKQNFMEILTPSKSANKAQKSNTVYVISSDEEDNLGFTATNVKVEVNKSNEVSVSVKMGKEPHNDKMLNLNTKKFKKVSQTQPSSNDLSEIRLNIKTENHKPEIVSKTFSRGDSQVASTSNATTAVKPTTTINNSRANIQIKQERSETNTVLSPSKRGTRVASDDLRIAQNTDWDATIAVYPTTTIINSNTNIQRIQERSEMKNTLQSPSKRGTRVASDDLRIAQNTDWDATIEVNPTTTIINSNTNIQRTQEISEMKNTVQSPSKRETRVASDDLRFVENIDWTKEIFVPPTETVQSNHNQTASHQPTPETYNALTYCISNAKKYAQVLMDYPVTRDVAKKYENLSDAEKMLYLYLLGRNWNWIRSNKINYTFVEDLPTSLDILTDCNFIETMDKHNDLIDILHCLDCAELKQLCDLQKIDKNAKKEELVKKLIDSTKKKSFFTLTSNLEEKIKERALRLINKTVIRLRAEPREIFKKFLVAATCPYYNDDEKDRLKDLKLTLENILYKRSVLLPLNPVPKQLFRTMAQFEKYYTALQLKEKIQIARESKKWKELADLSEQAMLEFKLFLETSCDISILADEANGDSRFTAGAVLAYCLSSTIDVLKKEKRYDEALSAIDLLLSQYYFVLRRRKNWYEEKALILERYKKEDIANVAQVIITGLKDHTMTVLGQRVLSKKAENYTVKKTKKLPESMLTELNQLLNIPKITTLIETIYAKGMPNIAKGKQTFEISIDGTKAYCSVEETAINHYKSTFPEALHDEGEFVKSIALAVFYPIIYECDIPFAFISELQIKPLDWGGRSFYTKRKSQIESYIIELLDKGIDGIIEDLKVLCMKISKCESLINTRYICQDYMPCIRHMLDCMQLEKFIHFATYLLENFGERKSGLPDLTLFNPTTKQCAFIEVKGPTDTPAIHQILWLEKLREFGLNASICKVELQSTMCDKKKSSTTLFSSDNSHSQSLP